MSTRMPRRGAAAEDPQIAGRRAVMARDAGLRRISRMTRRLVLGAVALSGALAVAAANAFHGHTIASGNSPSTTSSSQGSSATQQSTPPSATDGLSAPAQTPVQTPAPPVVVSGGS